MRRVISIVIPGAGLGSRMGLDKPKLLLEVGGLSLLERHYRMTSDIGHVAVVAGFNSAAVVQMSRAVCTGIIIVMNQNYAQTGTAGSVKLASKYLPAGDILVLDGDVLFEKRAIAEAIKTGESCLGVGPVRSREPVFAHLSSDGRYVTELTQERVSEFEWSGLAILSQDEITTYGDQHMFSSINNALPKRAIRVEWHEIDYPEDYSLAENWILEHG